MPRKGWSLLGSYRRLGRDARLMLVCTALSAVCQGAYGAVWQLYLKSAGYGGTWIGAYSFISSLLMTLLVLPAGVMADRVRRKALAILSSSLAVLSVAMVLISTVKEALVASAAVGGISWALGGPAWNALYAETVEDVGMDVGYSANAFVNSAFASLGSFLGWVPEFMVGRGLQYFSSYRMFLWWIAALQAISVTPLLLVREKFAPSEVERPRFKLKSKGVAARFAVVNVLIGFGAGLSIPLIGYYFSVKFGVESGPIGTLFAIVNIITAPAFLLAAGISSRIGTVKGAVVPQAASIPLLALIPSSPSFAVASALYIPRAILMNMANPLIHALMMKLTPEEERGTITAIFQISWNLPNSAAQQVGGIVMDRVSLDAPLYATSAIYVVYVTVFYLLFHGFEREIEEKAESEEAPQEGPSE
ncbi:MAG TPA: MFS transporter [Candidatus Korarchaeota archaeon]|nr:MFS transporter [Candidatus Korarchaeota archaeon]